MATSVVTQAILVTAEKGVNRLLQLDNTALTQLTKLADKVIAIQNTTPPSHTLFILITEQGVYLTMDSDITANCKITASLPMLLQLLLASNKQELLANSRIMLVGESSVAFTVCNILDNLNPDWQYELSQWFGPAVAGIITQSVKTGSEQLQAGVSFIQQQMSNLFTNITSAEGEDKTPNVNPFADLLGLLQKKFGQP